MLAKFFDTNRDGWKKNERKFHMKGVCSAEECVAQAKELQAELKDVKLIQEVAKA